jgi:hypothetical protein
MPAWPSSHRACHSEGVRFVYYKCALGDSINKGNGEVLRNLVPVWNVNEIRISKWLRLP